MSVDDRFLYGGTRPWESALWVTSDDRVRGGASRSHLFVVNPERARFYGHLDTSVLGGAGFASQHTFGKLDLDLSAYEGIVVRVIESDEKRYLLTLKDELPEPRDDGRERSGVSWEAEFGEHSGTETDVANAHISGPDPKFPIPVGSRDFFLPWSSFQPTYRGRPKPDAKPLDLTGIKRLGFMMRSFFGEQEGDFSLDVHSIAARRRFSAEHNDYAGRGVSCAQANDGRKGGRHMGQADSVTGESLSVSSESLGSLKEHPHAKAGPSWWARLFLCGRSP